VFVSSLPGATTRHTDVVKVLSTMQKVFRSYVIACMLQILVNSHRRRGTIDF
jgi:hypothetical protein